MHDICIENPTYDDVDEKYRAFIEKAHKDLNKAFPNNQHGGWGLRVYISEEFKHIGKYILIFWEDPYDIKLKVMFDGAVQFFAEDTTNNHVFFSRYISYEDLHIGEINFFIDSLKEFFAIQKKMHKFTSSYNKKVLPIGYKRDEKLDKLLD